MKNDKIKLAELKKKIEESKLRNEQQQKLMALTQKRGIEKRDKMIAAKIAEAQAQAEKRKADAEAKERGETVEEKKDEDAKMEDTKEDAKEEPEVDEEMEELKKPIVYEIPKADLVLSDEEKKQPFRKHSLPDVSSRHLSGCFTEFCIPTKGEGFDEVKFLWSQQATCEKRIRTFTADRKVTQKIEDLAPCEWFTKKAKEWAVESQSLNYKVRQYKQVKLDKLRKNLVRAAQKKNAEKMAADKLARDKENAEKQESENAEKKDEEKKEDEEEKKEEDKKEEKKEEEDAKMEDKVESEEEEEEDETEVDVWDCANVEDINGRGRPLYIDFENDDWALLSLRYELHLMAHAYKKDANDPERPGIFENNIAFYFSKYFQRSFVLDNFGVTNAAELLAMTDLSNSLVEAGKLKVLSSDLNEESELPLFIKITEEARRERKRRIDTGDEAAVLKFKHVPVQQQQQYQGGYQGQQRHQGGKQGGKGQFQQFNQRLGDQGKGAPQWQAPSSYGGKGGFQGEKRPMPDLRSQQGGFQQPFDPNKRFKGTDNFKGGGGKPFSNQGKGGFVGGKTGFKGGGYQGGKF